MFAFNFDLCRYIEATRGGHRAEGGHVSGAGGGEATRGDKWAQGGYVPGIVL
jgi:hypothetical protein